MKMLYPCIYTKLNVQYHSFQESLFVELKNDTLNRLMYMYTCTIATSLTKIRNIKIPVWECTLICHAYISFWQTWEIQTWVDPHCGPQLVLTVHCNFLPQIHDTVLSVVILCISLSLSELFLGLCQHNSPTKYNNSKN